MIADLSKVKDAQGELIIGLQVNGFDFTYAVVSREGVHDIGDATLPDKTPAGKALQHHDRVMLCFANIAKLVRQTKAKGVVYDKDNQNMGFIIPILSLVENVPFTGLDNNQVSMGFGVKHKSQVVKLLRDTIKMTDNETQKEKTVTDAQAAAIAYATCGVKIRAGAIRQELQQSILTPGGARA